MSKKLDKHDVRMIDQHTWYYLDRAGLEVFHQIVRDITFTDKFIIPYRRIIADLKQMGKIK